jgi:hypothetical protein
VVEIVGQGGSLALAQSVYHNRHDCDIVAQTVEVMPSNSVITIVQEPDIVDSPDPDPWANRC